MGTTQFSKIFLALTLFLLAFAGTVHADKANLQVNPDANILKQEMQDASSEFVGVVRGFFAFVTAALITWAFVILGTSTNPNKIEQVKLRFGLAVLSLVGVYFSDKIVAMTRGIFGLE
ncbi:hypothetical protein [Brevibacillus dissolubilis]|uniref:hypothetical protein n=1 Tax=Brevibacillus dissolubilis TaxID=1844116 RepID=UPI001117A9BB|nr:hypothetical protein [Brevibacillus dissolubilis]